MSLPASEQRALETIDSDLRAADKRLASMFRVFTELTRLEKMPRIETFQPVSWWTRAARRQPSCALPGCRRPGHRGLSRPWQRTGRNRLGALVLVPLLLAATLSLLLLTVLTTSPVRSGRCAQTTLFTAPVRLAGTGCTAGSAAHSGPAGG
jgi:hypothetical protein